jgi:phage baseplate assembly protein gpV
MDTLENLIMRCIERFMASRYSERHGLVTSYDPDKHLAKVMFKPENQESGWIPIETGHIGNGYGIATGLTPGDGEKTGDQVIVRYQENDFEGGKIVQRVHSNEDKPPKVEAGESVMWTQWGQQIKFHKDGTMTFIDGKGASVRVDGSGQSIVKHKEDDNSAAAATDHTHIRFGGMRIWVDGAGCWSSVPIRRADCTDDFKGS